MTVHGHQLASAHAAARRLQATTATTDRHRRIRLVPSMFHRPEHRRSSALDGVRFAVELLNVLHVAPGAANTGRPVREKAQLGSGVPTMGVVVAPWETYGVTVDVALQADDARARVQTWCDAVAQAIDRDLLAALVAAAGTGVADLAAAVNAVSAYSGPIIVVAPVGTADLRASGYEVVVDPNAARDPRRCAQWATLSSR